MRQLLPEALDDVDPVASYAADERTPPPGRPWVVVNMVTTADGATALEGVSGRLGGPGDRRVFHAVRAVADIILVGAGTVRAERYGPPRLDDAVQEQRVLRGQTPRPRLAVVSASLDLDLDADAFADDPAPLVVTGPGSATGRRVEVADRADLLLAGQGERVELPAALSAFVELGAQVVLAEGGPALNGQLVDADLVDELCLTLAPTVAGGASARLATGAEPRERGFILDRVLEEDGALFLRYVRQRVS